MGGLPALSHAIFGPDLTLFYLHVPQFITWHAVELVNSWTHLWGYAPYADGMVPECTSTNAAWLVAFSGGEIWHNNHHARPDAASFQEECWELDLGFYFIRMLEALGLAWDVRMPPRTVALGREQAHPLEALKALAGLALFIVAWRFFASKLCTPSSSAMSGSGWGFMHGPLGRLIQRILAGFSLPI